MSFFKQACKCVLVIIGGFFFFVASTSAKTLQADDYLYQFLQRSLYVKATFIQTLYSSSSQGVRAKTSQGLVQWARPGQFRFDYQKPYTQVLVGNGKTVWFYDADLAQVQIRKQKDLMPTSIWTWLIQESPNKAVLAQWKPTFLPSSVDMPHRQQLQIQVPLMQGTQPQKVTLQFENNQLIRIATTYQQQRIEIELLNWQSFSSLSSALFEFQIPPQTEVIRL